MQQPAEAVVARHAAFAVAEDVHGGEVEALAVVLHQVLQRLRIVVQADGAGMVDAERIEQIGELESRQEIDAALPRQLGQLGIRQALAGLRRLDREVVRHQRVHAVDR